MNEQRMQFDLSSFREGGVVTAAALALWALVTAGGASQVGQLLVVVGTGLMGIITMLLRHWLEKSGRKDRSELRQLREENRSQDAALRLQATQIDQLSLELHLLRQRQEQSRSNDAS